MLSTLTTYLFGVLLAAGVGTGLLAVGYVLETIIETCLPERYKPFDLVRLKDEERRAAARKMKINMLRAAKLKTHLSPAEEMMRRVALIPVTEEELEIAMTDAFAEHEARERGYACENLAETQINGESVEEFPVGNYEAEDLTAEVEALAKPKIVVPKRIQRVVINRFPLTERSEYLGGFLLNGNAVWTRRQGAKIFLTDTPELEEALLRAGKNSPTEIFVLRSDGSGIAVPKLKHKGAGA